MKSRKLWVCLLIVAVMLVTAGTALADNTVSSSQKWDVTVGKATDDGVSLDSMFPKVIFVHEGDSVTFTNGSMFTPHTVTFLAGSNPLNPTDPAAFAPTAASGSQWDGKSLLNSGILEPGKSYSITFTTVGAYGYLCILHPMMTGTVVVLPKGAAIPSAVEQAAAVKAQTNDLIEQANALKAANSGMTDYSVNADGTLTYRVVAGVGNMGFTVNRMFPETVVISEGDSVEWMNHNHYEPHFVTFNKPEDLNIIENGGINPKFFPPAGGPVFDGTGFVNSGMMLPGGENFKLTFSKAGTYTYECYLHSGDKMVGSVIVLPKDAVKVLVNGKPLVYDYKLPHLDNNHVYAAIVPFVEALGGKVNWDDNLAAVIVDIGGEHAVPTELAQTGGLLVVVNGKQLVYGFDPAPHLHDDHGYFPLQEVVSMLGGSYCWDEVSKTFTVTVQTAKKQADAHDMSGMNMKR